MSAPSDDEFYRVQMERNWITGKRRYRVVDGSHVARMRVTTVGGSVDAVFTSRRKAVRHARRLNENRAWEVVRYE